MTPTIREFVLAMGSSLPASMVAKATIIAAFGLMGARLARRSRAAVRHVLLAATFTVLLLLPVASLIVPPVRIAVPTAWTSSAVSSAPAVGGKEILPFTPPEARPAETSAASRRREETISTRRFRLRFFPATNIRRSRRARRSHPAGLRSIQRRSRFRRARLRVTSRDLHWE